MLFSEGKKDLDNEQKAWFLFIPFVCFATLARKRKMGILFFNMLKKPEVLLF